MTTDKPKFSDIETASLIYAQLTTLQNDLERAQNDKFDIVEFNEEASNYAWHTYLGISQKECGRIAKAAIIDLHEKQIKESKQKLVALGFASDAPKLLEAPVADVTT